MRTDSGDERVVLELWMDSPSKVKLAAFFRKNPGVIDTLDGLSQRLAIPGDRLAPDLEDHVRLGVLRQRRLAEHTVYVLDRVKYREIEEMLEDRARVGRRRA